MITRVLLRLIGLIVERIVGWSGLFDYLFPVYYLATYWLYYYNYIF